MIRGIDYQFAGLSFVRRPMIIDQGKARKWIAQCCLLDNVASSHILGVGRYYQWP